jgi:hypothetical protein
VMRSPLKMRRNSKLELTVVQFVGKEGQVRGVAAEDLPPVQQIKRRLSDSWEWLGRPLNMQQK